MKLEKKNIGFHENRGKLIKSLMKLYFFRNLEDFNLVFLMKTQNRKFTRSQNYLRERKLKMKATKINT